MHGDTATMSSALGVVKILDGMVTEVERLADQ
jgi:hypothetical protein